MQPTSTAGPVAVPDVHQAEPIPAAAREAIDALMQTADLFRYNSDEAPVTLLEAEFAEMMGTRYALAVSSCSAALFLSLKALGLPRDARVLIPGFTFAAVPSSVIHGHQLPDQSGRFRGEAGSGYFSRHHLAHARTYI